MLFFFTLLSSLCAIIWSGPFGPGLVVSLISTLLDSLDCLWVRADTIGSGVRKLAIPCMYTVSVLSFKSTFFFPSRLLNESLCNSLPDYMLHRRLSGSWSKSEGIMSLRQNTTSVAAVQSRNHRLFTIQELFLEYSLALILLGCFILVSLSSKIARTFGAPEVGVSRIWTQ